jgi:hypothetical protein
MVTADDAPRSPTGAVVLRLVIAAGDGVAGTIAVEGDDTAVPFDGWVELMATISAARTGRPIPPEAS